MKVVRRTVGIKINRAVPVQISVKSIAPPRPTSRPTEIEKTLVVTAKII